MIGSVETPEKEVWRVGASTAAKGLILVVEDEFDLREMLTFILQSEGYRVIPTADGCDALEQFSRNSTKVDLVIADLHLPTFGGVELFERITGMGCHPKILICSGLMDTKTVQQLTATGITDYITKPFRIPDFLTKVEEVMRR